MTTLFHLLQRRRGETDATAIVSCDDGTTHTKTLSYAELFAQACQAATVLQQAGVSAGDVVLMLLPNDANFVVAFLAVAFCRAVAGPLNPAYTRDELQFYATSGSPRFLLVDRSYPAPEGVAVAQQHGIPVVEAAWVQGAVVLEEASVGRRALRSTMPLCPLPEDVCLFLHTSGTTGNPKGVPLTHGNLCTTIANVGNTYRLSPQDTSLLVMPLFHVHGLIGVLLSTLASGGRVVIQAPKFSAGRFWKDFVEHGCTWYSAVPTIHQILLRGAHKDFHGHGGKLRFIRSCSSALAPAVLQELESTFQAPVLEAYAMTEASHQVSSNPLPPAVHKAGSVGIPQGVAICIMDDNGQPLPANQLGEVCVRGKNVTSGYWRNPQATKKSFYDGGWFRTGDQGLQDKDGYLFLTGRLKELINRAGEKISPLEVDAVLLQHPGVAEAVTFGVPDAMHGEEVHAAVVPKDASSVTAAELERFCASKLAAFKCPKKFYVASDLPRTATGKIQRNKVAAHFTAPPSKL